ncbi:Miro domain protein [Pelomyxa schiedti]|nr:Miro domain protein [Pelomyxa schiedti]
MAGVSGTRTVVAPVTSLPGAPPIVRFGRLARSPLAMTAEEVDSTKKKVEGEVEALLGKTPQRDLLFVGFRRLATRECFPDILWGCDHITSLILSNNDCIDLPPQITQLASLRVLDLGSNYLEGLPSLEGLENLITLRLTGNRFKIIPPEVTSLSKLHTLHLNNNVITEIPVQIGNLTGLTELLLSQNQISSIPEEFGSLTCLNTLRLGANRIHSLPHTFSKLSNLTTLDIAENQLDEFPACIYSFTHLTELQLQENHISTFSEPRSQLSRLSALRVLNLSNNKVKEIPELFSLHSLNTLHLENNDINNFSCLLNPALVALNLQSNRIAVIPPQISCMRNLVALDLCYNEIEEFPPEMPPALKQFLLIGNPILYREPAVALPKGCIADSGERSSNEIIPGLWLGSQLAGKNKYLLKSRHVTHVVTVLDVKVGVYPHDFNYFIIPVEDEESTDLLSHFEACHQFMDEALEHGTAVLVHCAAGISRSATIVISYLMAKRRISVEEAHKFVSAARPIIYPNSAFMHQLHVFGEKLGCPPDGEQKPEEPPTAKATSTTTTTSKAHSNDHCILC